MNCSAAKDLNVAALRIQSRGIDCVVGERPHCGSSSDDSTGLSDRDGVERYRGG